VAVSNEQAMNALLRDLADLLTHEPLGVDDVVARVGPVVRDPGAPMAIELGPTLPGIGAARLARYPDSGEPYMLDLVLDRNARLTVATLKALFGEYDRALTDRLRPPELLFHLPAGTARWRVVLIAQLAPGAGSLDAAPVSVVAFRRDPIPAGAP
jgi:hypothetical protein